MYTIYVISNNEKLNNKLKYFSRYFNIKCSFICHNDIINHVSNKEILIMYEPTINIIKNIRKYSNSIIICIYDSYNQKEIINAYKNNIDDYYIIPFSYAELFYKINILHKRNNNYYSDDIAYNELELKYNRKEAYIGNIALNLTYKEFILLYILVKNKNTYVTREYLLSTIWENNTSTRSIDTNICTLRRKMIKYKTNIECKSKVGYIFKTQ